MKALPLCAVGVLLSLFSFAQQKPASSSASSGSIDGIWLGTLHAGAQTLRIQVHLLTNAGARTFGHTCSLDSSDQNALGIPCTIVAVNGSSVSFDVPAVSGKWSGQLSADGQTLTGTWTQGESLPLVFERQLTEGPQNAPPACEPALPPVTPEDLQAVLDRDLAPALK